MKKVFNAQILALIFLIGFSYPTKAVAPSPVSSKEKIEKPLLKDLLTVDDILNKKLSEIEKKLGRKLKIKDQITLSVIKGNIKRAQKSGSSEAEMKILLAKDQSNLATKAILLGFFLSIIGVGLAYLFWDKQIAKSSWVGAGWGITALAGLGLVVILILLLVFTAWLFYAFF